MRERHRQAIAKRWFLAVLSVAMALVGHWMGLRGGDGHAAVVILIETLFLVGTGWLATTGPTAYTRRLRRVRQALAGASQGDFTARLGGRHLDDIGFLSVSVNSMSEA